MVVLTRLRMNNWSIVILLLFTWVFIHALYVNEKCYSTNPCHFHRLKCNEGNINRKIAITDAKFGFKTSACSIEGCDFSCCMEEPGDCYEPFSKDVPVQRSLYDQCEYQEECSLDKPYRTRGCRSGLSTFSRIEYECLEESSILRTAGSKQQQKLSVMFRGSDPGFPSSGMSCSIQTSGLLRITNYYTRLAHGRFEDAQARSKTDFFNNTDCSTGYKMSVHINDGPMFLCHEEGEFFYTQPRDITETNIDMNLVINRQEDTDVIWLGFFTPRVRGTVNVSCKNLVKSVASTTAPMNVTTTAPMNATTAASMNATTAASMNATTTASMNDTTAASTTQITAASTGIGVGVGLGVIIGLICLIVVVYIIKKRSKPTTEPIEIYSELAVNGQEEANNYTYLDKGHMSRPAEPTYENY